MYRNAPFRPPRLSSDLGESQSKRPAPQNALASKRVSLNRPVSGRVSLVASKELNDQSPPQTQSNGSINGHKRPEQAGLFVDEIASQTDECSTMESVSDVSRKYTVQWRKKSTKKNKTWEGDGTLTQVNSQIILRDEDGNLLSKKKLNINDKIDLTTIIPIGIYEIEINEELDHFPQPELQPQLRSVKKSNSVVSAIKVNTIPSLASKYPKASSISSTESIGNNSQQNNSQTNSLGKYTVQWRKKSTKKNKTWEGDGTLTVTDKLISLKDEDGSLLCKKSQSNDVLNLKSILSIGNYEIEVSEENVPPPVSTTVRKIPFQTPSKVALFHEPAVDRQVSGGDANCDSNTQTTSSTVYSIHWRKKTNKKNKTWDDDGTVTASNINGSVVLSVKDSNGKVLTKKSYSPTTPPSFTNCIFSIGGIEFEVEAQTTNEENDGLPSLNENVAFKPVRVQNGIAQEPNTRGKSPSPETNAYTNPKSIILPRKGDALHDVSIDPHIAVHLRPHQIEGITFLYECVMGFRLFEGNGCLLADEMGLGKTLMTITLIWTLLRQSPFKKGAAISNILIVCPVTLINNWVSEFKKWLGSNKIGILTLSGNNANDKASILNFAKLNVYQVLILNYEKVGTYFDELSTVPFDMLVCDEGHRLKTSSNKVLNHLANLNIPKRILLTGTPIQNDLVEFYTILNFVNPGILGEFKTFQKTYINPIVKSRDVHCFDLSMKKRGEELSNELIRITQQFILRRTQAILTKYLTKKTDTIIFVPPTQLQTNLFDFILRLPAFSEQIESSNQAFTLINLFKKICNSPSLLANDNFFKSIETENKFHLTTSSGKINILIPLLLEITSMKEKIVLISNYTKTLNLLELVLKKLNLQFIRLDGSTPNNVRSKLVNAFNKTDSINVFLLSSKSGGMGINLVGASRLILFDNDWNPAVDLQSMSRIHRDGQTKHCYIYRLMTTGCIDEKIFQRQLMKNNLSSTFLDNESETNDNVFDDYEMKKLFEVDYLTNCNTHDLLECTCKGDGTEPMGEADITLEDAEDEEADSQVLNTQSWVSAKQLMDSIDENEQNQNLNKKSQIRNALHDYIHFDPNSGDPDLIEDDVLVNIIKNKKFKESNSKFPMSFILCKTTNNVESELDSTV